MENKLTATDIENMAKEIREFLIEHELWVDTVIYFNGKAFSTSDGKGNYYYNDPEHLIVLENQNPKDYFEYAGDILSMSFEGDLNHCLNYYYDIDFCDRIVGGLQDIFRKYGCYYELGNAWNLSLYRA